MGICSDCMVHEGVEPDILRSFSEIPISLIRAIP